MVALQQSALLLAVSSLAWTGRSRQAASCLSANMELAVLWTAWLDPTTASIMEVMTARSPPYRGRLEVSEANSSARLVSAPASPELILSSRALVQ